jgi:hypothetical protein
MESGDPNDGTEAEQPEKTEKELNHKRFSFYRLVVHLHIQPRLPFIHRQSTYRLLDMTTVTPRSDNSSMLTNPRPSFYFLFKLDHEFLKMPPTRTYQDNEMPVLYLQSLIHTTSFNFLEMELLPTNNSISFEEAISTPIPDMEVEDDE